MTAELLQKIIELAQVAADEGVVVRSISFDAICRMDGTAKITQARVDSTFATVGNRQ